ncbi:hypothetical protein LTR85_005617 [Meristemomyces frigidus]|nr:hypothetical protein LTR85_005617 [Meristemomyces frigidus]
MSARCEAAYNTALSPTYDIPRVKATSFLDLPPELRNGIYDQVYETQDTTRKVNLLFAHTAAPSTGLTGTCRQLRQETLTLLRDAREVFVHTHDFYLPLSLEDLVKGSAGGGPPPAPLQHILDRLAFSSPLLCRFTVRIMSTGMSGSVVTQHVWRRVVFTAADDGQVKVNDPYFGGSSQPDFGAHIRECAKSRQIWLSQVVDPTFLDLYGVVRAVVENYGWTAADKAQAWTASMIDEVLAVLEESEEDDESETGDDDGRS